MDLFLFMIFDIERAFKILFFGMNGYNNMLKMNLKKCYQDQNEINKIYVKYLFNKVLYYQKN